MFYNDDRTETELRGETWALLTHPGSCYCGVYNRIKDETQHQDSVSHFYIIRVPPAIYVENTETMIR